MKGAWQAGVATIMKNGLDSSDCSFMKFTACLFLNKKKVNVIKCMYSTLGMSSCCSDEAGVSLSTIPRTMLGSWQGQPCRIG